MTEQNYAPLTEEDATATMDGDFYNRTLGRKSWRPDAQYQVVVTDAKPFRSSKKGTPGIELTLNAVTDPSEGEPRRLSPAIKHQVWVPIPTKEQPDISEGRAKMWHKFLMLMDQTESFPQWSPDERVFRAVTEEGTPGDVIDNKTAKGIKHEILQKEGAIARQYFFNPTTCAELKEETFFITTREETYVNKDGDTQSSVKVSFLNGTPNDKIPVTYTDHFVTVA